MIQNGCSSILCGNLMDEISSSLAKNFKFTDKSVLKRLVKKELATTWGCAQLHKVFNFEWCWQPQAGKKSLCSTHILKRLPKIHDNNTKGKKMHHKQSSSVLKGIEKTTIVTRWYNFFWTFSYLFRFETKSCAASVEEFWKLRVLRECMKRQF